MGDGLTSLELRRLFRDFFESRGHDFVESAPLVPRRDPTLLFTSAGMVQFKPYYVMDEPPLKRAVSIQRCLRLSDLEEVGHSPYHDTFFEMLGNFSFGDYFKRETIEWGWEFLTGVLGLPKEELWISVYEDDEHAAEIWRTRIGIPENRIVPLGDDDNFWGPAGASGACGPCSEIHMDMGPSMGCGREGCNPGCDCNRFFEVWNLVFPQFYQHEDGTREPLARPGIDTGMGLERLCTVMQNERSIFKTDLFYPIVLATRGEVEAAGGALPPGDDVGTELAVIADHVRAATFTIAENILPSNEGQGYVVRRLVRRAVRRGKSLGIDGPFLYRLCGGVVDMMGGAHPHIKDKREHIAMVIKSEEERFLDTLAQGTIVFEEMVERLAKSGSNLIPGERAFTLYDTYGFPLDLTQEMARERGLEVDFEGFDEEMEKQRERGRRASATWQQLAGVRGWEHTSGEDGDSRFVGYELPPATVHEAESVSDGYMSEPVAARVTRTRPAPEAGEIEFALSVTPFYAEAGGQVADTGLLRAGGIAAEVVNAYHEGDVIVHVGKALEGSPTVGSEVEVSVDLSRRRRVEKNHTATHLLQAALRATLGDHVHQSGSWVGPDRLRFDFTHFSELTDREVRSVEDRVNAWIRSDLEACPELMPRDEALGRGALALFGEKYGHEVRLVCVPGVSMELCGGTHVGRTGEIGAFTIVGETSIAAGVRRIEAVTGADAIVRARGDAERLRMVATALKGSVEDAVTRALELLAQNVQLRKELSREREKSAGQSVGDLVQSAQEVNGVKVVASRTDVCDLAALRALADALRAQLTGGVGVLGAVFGERATLLAVVTDDLVESRKLRAGDVVREVAALMGGRGGGKAHMAQAGGGDIDKFDEALSAAPEIVAKLLGD